jgi:hypothetical protein
VPASSSPVRLVDSAKTRKRSKGAPPLPDAPLHITSLENLDEITAWLGTFRERLRIAHPKDQPKLDAATKELETHYRRRRAELS